MDPVCASSASNASGPSVVCHCSRSRKLVERSSLLRFFCVPSSRASQNEWNLRLRQQSSSTASGPWLITRGVAMVVRQRWIQLFREVQQAEWVQREQVQRAGTESRHGLQQPRQQQGSQPKHAAGARPDSEACLRAADAQATEPRVQPYLRLAPLCNLNQEPRSFLRRQPAR